MLILEPHKYHVIAEYKRADAILAQHIGPTHPIRKGLAELIAEQEACFIRAVPRPAKAE